MEWIHITVMEEEGLTIGQLPNEIKSKIKAFNAQKGKYDKNPTDNLLNSLKTLSVKIADSIQSFVEQDLDDDDDDDNRNNGGGDSNGNSDGKTNSNANANTNSGANNNINTNSNSNKNNSSASGEGGSSSNQNSDNNKKIIEIVKKDGYIRQAKISSLLDRPVNDVYVEIDGVRLKKGLMMFNTVYRLA